MRKKETITLSIPPGAKEQLEAIASQLNLLWGDRPSISALIVAIAQKELELGQRFSLSKVQVQALDQAIKLLIDSNFIPESKTLASLIIERGNPDPPLRQKLLEQVSTSDQVWRVLLEQQIAKKQPFRLFYRDSQQQQWEFTVRFAEITFREKRYYLEIWAEETEGNSDLPELKHNRCLRLDRIENLTLLPTDGKWRKGLDATKVYLHFCGGLVKAYDSRQGDLENYEENEIRKVTRSVSNTFWLLREIRHYGTQCQIIAPESVREKMKQELREMCQQYGLNISD
jgi:WYL domain